MAFVKSAIWSTDDSVPSESCPLHQPQDGDRELGDCQDHTLAPPKHGRDQLAIDVLGPGRITFLNHAAYLVDSDTTGKRRAKADNPRPQTRTNLSHVTLHAVQGVNTYETMSLVAEDESHASLDREDGADGAPFALRGKARSEDGASLLSQTVAKFLNQ